MARQYHQGERPHPVFSQYAGESRNNRYFYLRVGRVIEIDYDRYQFKVEWVTGGGSPEWMPISFPYVGPGSCIGTLPEHGALGIFGYLDEGSGKGTPLSLTFLPVSLQAALDHNFLKLTPDAIPTEEESIIGLKFRKLRRGDMIMSSLWGGEIFVNNNIELRDSAHDSLVMRHSDQSLLMTSLNNFVFADGVTVAAGHIIRNFFSTLDGSGKRKSDILARDVTLPDGRTMVCLVPFGNPVDENARYYSEYRIDVDDVVDGLLDVNEINSQAVAANKDPVVTQVMGNYAIASENHRAYGRIVRPVLFSTQKAINGQFNLIECSQNKGVDEVGLLGIAWAVHLLKNNAFMGFDKEGHLYLNLGASTSANSTMGAGLSMSVLAPGSVKESYGLASTDNNSWDLTTKGGVRWSIGTHNGKQGSSSIDIKTSGGVRLEVRGESDSGYAREEMILGKQVVSIGGHDTKEVSGNSTLTVDGLRQETIRGAASYQYHCDKTENCLGMYTQNVVKEMQGKFGKRKETVLLGQELEIMTGDDKETIKTFGNKKTKLTLGNIEEQILVGNRKVSIKAGHFKVDILAGNIEIKTKVGKAKIDALGGVTIQSLTKVDIKALKVGLGMGPQGAVVAGLPGLPTHLDYVTGIPLKGAMTVKAGP
jgi:hypothetical protein